MQFVRHTADVEARLGLRRFFLFGLAISMLTNVLLAMALVAKDNNHRQTIVPPVITDTFWIDDRALSESYLKQMASFALQLALNNTPANAAHNARDLLALVAPGSYGEIERALLANAERLRRNNASTTFSPTGVTVDPGTRSVLYHGVLSTWIGDKRTSQLSKAYIVRFGYSGGKTYIRELREAPSKEPFKEVSGEDQTTE